MRRPKTETRTLACQYFTFNVYRRGETYYADGRGNTPKLGRYSLGATTLPEATANLRQLDRKLAVEHGLADRSILLNIEKSLPLEDGRQLFEEHVSRPVVMGGTRPSTQKRYRSILRKFIEFAKGEGISSWSQVNRNVLERYATHLERRGRAPSTMLVALTTIKQILKWLVEEGRIPESCRVRMTLRGSRESTTHCWTDEEFDAIQAQCRGRHDLHWLGNILTTLGFTGMRISELEQLKWADIDLKTGFITLTDETYRLSASGNGTPRTLKGKRGRSIPIHELLRPILECLPRAADGYVFHGPRGGRTDQDVVRDTLVREVLKPLAPRFPAPAGRKGFVHGRLHSFRHYFCSRCANCGTPERAVMKWLGHAHADMVRRYYHLNDDESRLMMSRVSIQSVAAENNVIGGKPVGLEDPVPDSA